MTRLMLFVALAAGALTLAAGNAQAQYVTYYSPVVAPAPVVVHRPVTHVVASPVVAPVSYTVARPVAVAPVAYARTRWRPFLGGTVTRVRYGYSTVYGY